MEEIAVILLLLPGVIFLAAVVGMMLMHRREMMAARHGGICGRCGCSLTGNTSGKCPGCGMSVPPFASISDDSQTPE